MRASNPPTLPGLYLLQDATVAEIACCKWSPRALWRRRGDDFVARIGGE